MPASDRNLAAIVLAAGMSRRMGRLKMLLPFGGKPMLARVIESLVACREIAAIKVVTGHAEQEIRAAIGEYESVLWVYNADHAAGGMLSSVQSGVRTLPASRDAFFLALGDQPMVLPETLEAMTVAWNADIARIVIPTYGGKRGHPVLIATAFSAEILALAEGETLKTLMVRHERAVVEVQVTDPATVQDVDTPEDYEAALRRWQTIEH